jgi:hypothetical protein
MNYAEQIALALSALGVEILPIHPKLAVGGKVSGLSDDGLPWMQRHIDAEAERDPYGKVHIDALAANIARATKRIQFGNLFIPNKGCLVAEEYQHGNVVCRVLAMEQSGQLDEQYRLRKPLWRLDVLFCAHDAQAKQLKSA